MTLRQRWRQTSLANKLLVIFGGLVAFGTLVYAATTIIQIWPSKIRIVIHAQCQSEFLTTTPLPLGQTLKVLNLWPLPAAQGGGGLADVFMTKGNEYVWPKPKDFPFLTGYHCNVINYSGEPVFNIDMPLVEVFREINRDPNEPNNMHAGKIKVSRQWPITIDKIDPGTSNAFTFYVYNTSDTMVIVSLTDSVTLQTGADDGRQTIRLVHSNVPMQFWPQQFQ